VAYPVDDETERVEALHALHVLDTPREERFDRIVRLAHEVFDVPIVAINLVDSDRQFTKSAVGIHLTNVPREHSICQHTIQHESILEVPDLRLDPRFAESAYVAGPPHLRSYAGAPLRAPTGQRIGSLCLIGYHPTTLSDRERDILRDLADIVERELTMEGDLHQAGVVQRTLEPPRGPGVPGIDVAGRVVAARDAGGDYYDWMPVSAELNMIDDHDSLQVLVADVMGKGLPAALLAAGLRTVFRAHATYVDLGRAVHRTCLSLAQDLEDTGRFITLWAGRLDPRTGELAYVDAGHGLAAIVGPNGRSRRLTQEYLPLGMPELEPWRVQRDVLAPEELLVVVSDGLADLFPSIDEALESATDLARSGRSAAAIVELITSYASEHNASDDVTALVLRRTGAAG